MGLIRGAGPENAIILGKNGPENGPLRFADEYVRHKVLDLIGDLALAGPPHRGTRGGGARRTCHAHGAGVTADEGPLGVGAGPCAGEQLRSIGFGSGRRFRLFRSGIGGRIGHCTDRGAKRTYT